MATLKRNQMKYFSEDNMRKIVSLTVSLANKVDATAEKCINPFTPNTAYTKGSFVTYNNYIYEAKYACNDPDFVEAHWVKLSDEINEIDLNTVKSWLNLSQEELDNLQKILKDDQITTTSTFSSSKIFSDIQAAIETAKEYTNEQTGKCVKPVYKVVSSTSEVTETGYFYLISNGTNFDMYVLSADGSVVSLGTSDVDLTQFYDKNYIDNNFYTSADADGKFATITTVDGKVDKANIVSSISATPSDEKVLSEKGSSEKFNNINETLKGLVASVITEEVDVDNIQKSIKGWCVKLSGTLPKTMSAGWFENEYVNSSTISQKIITFTKDMYVRQMFGGTWSDWSIITPPPVNYCNPNLLCNPWFIINQRGQTSYSNTANYFAVDRWRFTPGLTVTVNTDKTITITNTASSINWFGQQIYMSEMGLSGGETITQSIMLSDGTVYSSTCKFPTTVTSNDFEINQKGLAKIRVQRLTNDKYHCVFYVSPNSSITIRAAKVERGSISTIKNELAPNYTTELLKCQRYYQRYACTIAGYFCYGVANSADVVEIKYEFKVPMLSRPSVNVSNVADIRYNKFNEAVTASVSFVDMPVAPFSGATSGLEEMYLRFRDNVNSPFTIGQNVRLSMVPGAYIEFSAEP